MSKERLEGWKTQLKQAEWPSKSGPRTKRIEGCKRKIAYYEAKIKAADEAKAAQTPKPKPFKKKEGES